MKMSYSFSAIKHFEVNQIVSLWRNLSLKKTYLMMECNEEDLFPDLFSEFKEKLHARQKQQLKAKPKDLKKKFLTMLNEFVVLNLHETDEPMNPEYQ